MDIIKRLCAVATITTEDAATVNTAVVVLCQLQRIEEAARNLIAQKGRYNTETAYKRLEELFK